jgi:hypothetical protein
MVNANPSAVVGTALDIATAAGDIPDAVVRFNNLRPNHYCGWPFGLRKDHVVEASVRFDKAVVWTSAV